MIKKPSYQDLLKRVEELENAKADSLYHDLVETSQDLIWQCDADGRYTFLNSSWQEVLGYTIDEMLGKKFTDFQTPEQAAHDLQEFDRLLDGNTVKGLETIHISKNGKEIHLVFNAKFLTDKNGNIAGTRGTAYDNTDRKQMEASLRDSQELFEKMNENSPLGKHFYKLNENDELIFMNANPAANKLLKVDNSIFIGKTIQEAFPSLMQTEIPKRYYDAAKKGILWSTEQISYDDDLISGAFEVTAFQTKPGSMVATFSDITERKKAEELLKKERKLLNTYMETSPVGIVSVDKQGSISYANTMAINTLGLKINEIEKKTYNAPVWKITDIDGSDFPEENLPFNLVKKNLKPFYNVQHAIQVDSKKRIILSINAAPLLDKKGNFDGMISTVEDITKIKHYNSLIKEQNEELKEINKSKDQFLSILAHDLRSPFNSILGLLEIMVNKIRDYDIDKIEKHVKLVYSSAQGVYDLLNDLLLWGRTQTNKIQFNPQEIYFSDICTDISNQLEQSATIKGIIFNNKIEKEAKIHADIEMMKIVMRNLISNSIKFTNSGGKISIHLRRGEDFNTISVTDTGIGIKKEVLDILFVNSEIHSTKGTADEKGTGFGLILCKEIIEKHGGKIWALSEEGKGSQFSFTIPVSKDFLK